MRESSTKAIYLFLSLFVFILFLTTAAHAGPDTPIEPDYDPDAVVPIDGGASLLVAAGVAYGLKKIHEKRKESKKPSI